MTPHEDNVTVPELLQQIPPEYRGFRFEGYDAYTPALATALARVEEWADTFEAMPGEQRGLLLTGPTGVGKTRLTVAASYIVAARGFSVRYLDVSEVMDARFSLMCRRESFCAAADIPRNYFGRYPDLVVLEDLGSEQSADWVQDQVRKLVAALHVRGTAALVTSNLNYAELGERLGERTGDRLVEMTDRVEVSAPESWRVRTAKGRRAL